jgi:hypothetical protein
MIANILKIKKGVSDMNEINESDIYKLIRDNMACSSRLCGETDIARAIIKYIEDNYIITKK